MLDAFGADETIGDLLDFAGCTFNDDHFEAGIVIEMRVCRGDDDVVIFVLYVHELFR